MTHKINRVVPFLVTVLLIAGSMLPCKASVQLDMAIPGLAEHLHELETMGPTERSRLANIESNRQAQAYRQTLYWAHEENIEESVYQRFPPESVGKEHQAIYAWIRESLRIPKQFDFAAGTIEAIGTAEANGSAILAGRMYGTIWLRHTYSANCLHFSWDLRPNIGDRVAFSPYNSCTEEQAAAILASIADNVEDREVEQLGSLKDGRLFFITKSPYAQIWQPISSAQSFDESLLSPRDLKVWIGLPGDVRPYEVYSGFRSIPHFGSKGRNAHIVPSYFESLVTEAGTITNGKLGQEAISSFDLWPN
ncbi:MAG: hypothetical protein JOZ57_11170 [Abitibacteriaceae bacterium]|nr:hypothetical protein [Abditibacteriaceae bacterium]